MHSDESCGDGACTGAETCQSCASDCGGCPPACGDGVCNGGERCDSCSADCGACPPACGDGVCNGAERCDSCSDDCGACPPTCGDGVCNGGETCEGCTADCGACPPTCGDGVCNGGEICQTCAADCGGCPSTCVAGQGACIDRLSTAAPGIDGAVTINGQDLYQNVTTGWAPWLTATRSSFEGSGAIADGYIPASTEPSYDSTVAILGSKSLYNRISDSTPGACPGNNEFGRYVSTPNTLRAAGGDYYGRLYGRWVSTGTWPMYSKFYEWWQGLVYFQPNPWGAVPTSWSLDLTINGSFTPNNPSGAWVDGRWYVIEVHYKSTSPRVFEAWVDGQRVLSRTDAQLPSAVAFAGQDLIGIINGCWGTGTGTLEAWADGYVASTQRVYPAAEVWLCPTASFDDAACAWQYITHITDTQVEFTFSKSGHSSASSHVTIPSGTGYVFVRNNERQVSNGQAVTVP